MPTPNIFQNGDCLRLMRDIPDHSVQLVLTDLPYSTTRNTWDHPIPLDALWVELRRIIKPRGAIVMFAQTPFDKVLGASNIPWLRYEWIWQKEQGTGHLNSKFAPMKNHENILVFSPSGAAFNKRAETQMLYHPQYRTGKAYRSKHSGQCSTNYDTSHYRATSTINDGSHYMPLSILKFSRDNHTWHPTQKPEALCRYLIRTYSDPGDIILDPCAGSATTIVAAIRENRQYIGYELDTKIFERAQKRIQEAINNPQLFFE